VSETSIVQGLNAFLSSLSPQVKLQGWDRLAWGMSERDLLRNYPQARPRPGHDHQYQITSHDPAPNHYSIIYDFSRPGRQLQGVTLSFAGGQEGANFAAMSQELSRRLGAPVGQTATSSSWQRDSTRVTLSLSPGGGLVLSSLA
jgi:hypothetical protein